MTVVISQADYKIFKRKVNILASKGVILNHKVSKPNHKKVKINIADTYDWAELDRLCDG
jgi:hypothetical protein|tara:strand:+ start:485 stop:661 length:177 start_codon:yes stop_codon:yes gene_type:complete